MMRQLSTWRLDVEKLKEMGLDLEAYSMTASKGRPFVAVTSNYKVAWMVPLTTRLIEDNGRTRAVNDRFGERIDVCCVTTDMFPISREMWEACATRHGQLVEGGDALIEQLGFTLQSGRLGRKEGEQ